MDKQRDIVSKRQGTRLKSSLYLNDEIIQNVLVHKQLGMVIVMSQTLD